MYWNYRIIKHKEIYGIKEVYYNDDKITGWTENFVNILKNDILSELKFDMKWLKKALKYPVLEEKIVNGKEKLVEIKEKILDNEEKPAIIKEDKNITVEIKCCKCGKSIMPKGGECDVEDRRITLFAYPHKCK